MVKFRSLLVLILVGLLAACSTPASTPTLPLLQPTMGRPPTIAPAPNAPSTASVQPTALPPATQAAPQGFTVTDALSRTVKFERAPQRITLAGRAVIMLADAVYLFPEATTRVIATAKADQGAGNFLPVIDPTFPAKIGLELEAGPEQVAATKPELVLLKTMMADKLGKPLESLGIKVVYLDLETPEQYQRDLITLGQVFQNPARAQALTAYYRGQVERVSKGVAGVAEDKKPRVLLVQYTERDGQAAVNVPPLAFIQTLMVKTAGGRPVWDGMQVGSGWSKVNLEQVAAWNPDQIYVISYLGNIDEVLKKLKADSQWQALKAVKDGKLYGFPMDFYSWDQPDTRWSLGLTWLAARIHPDKFADMKITQEAQDFYKELYSLDQAAFEKSIKPKLKGDLN